MAESKDGNVQNLQKEKLSCLTSLCINVVKRFYLWTFVFNAKLDFKKIFIVKYEITNNFQFFQFHERISIIARIWSKPNWHPTSQRLPLLNCCRVKKLEKNFSQHGRQHNSKMRKTQGKVFVSMRRRRKFSNYAGKVSCAMLIKVQSQSSPLALTWGSKNFCEKLIKVSWSEKLAWNVKSYSGSRGGMEWRHETPHYAHTRV